MSVMALPGPSLPISPEHAHRHVKPRGPGVFKRIGNWFAKQYRYDDGRWWAPDIDMEGHPRVRRIVSALGKTARALSGVDRPVTPGRPLWQALFMWDDKGRSLAEHLAGHYYNSLDVDIYKGFGRAVDMTLYNNAWKKLGNALFEDSISGRGTEYARIGRGRITHDPRIDQLPADQQTETRLKCASMSILQTLANPQFGINVDLTDEDKRTAVGHHFYDTKLQLLDSASIAISPEERVPFEDLSASAQAAEIRQLEVAQHLFRTGHPGLEKTLQHVFSEQLGVSGF